MKRLNVVSILVCILLLAGCSGYREVACVEGTVVDIEWMPRADFVYFEIEKSTPNGIIPTIVAVPISKICSNIKVGALVEVCYMNRVKYNGYLTADFFFVIHLVKEDQNG